MELKPCPFCGGEAKMFKFNLDYIGSINKYAPKCSLCKCRGGKCKTEEKAAEAWNRRVNG